MVKAPMGLYSDPHNPDVARSWDPDNGWNAAAAPKSLIQEICQRSGVREPNWDIDPANAPEHLIFDQSEVINAVSRTFGLRNSHSEGWGNSSVIYLARYFDGFTLSEYFKVSALAESVAPDYYRNGGKTDFQNSPNSLTGSEKAVLAHLYGALTPELVRQRTHNSAWEYNEGQRWVVDQENPNLYHWWDGDKLTGDTILLGALMQIGYDAETDNPQTVSNTPVPDNAKPGTLYPDPEDDTQYIRWGGMRWDMRIPAEDKITEFLQHLGEELPETWRGNIHLTEFKTLELVDQIRARVNGVDGWYKEVEHFDDLSKRYWENGAWTDKFSKQVPGWFDDPDALELLRYWDGQKWTQKTRTKEAHQISLDRSERAKGFGKFLTYVALEAAFGAITPDPNKAAKDAAASAEHDRRWSQGLADDAHKAQKKFYEKRNRGW